MVIACGCLLAEGVSVASGQNLFGADWDSGILYRISEDNASLTAVGNTGLVLGSLELYSDGYLYGATTGSSAKLYRVDSQTATTSLIGPLGLDFVFEGGLAFDPNGIAYATNEGSASAPKLFRVNMTTGAATLVGLITGGAHDINGLAWRSDGMLIGLDREANALLTINPATGASSLLRGLTPLVGSVGGMAVLDGQGYFAIAGPMSSDPGSNSLYRFNLFTGEYSLVGSFGSVITGTGIAGLAAIPEPGSLALLGLASLAFAKRRMVRPA